MSAPLELQLPPVPEPETSAPPPSSQRFAPVRFRANAVGIPDTSAPGPVMLQQPSRWNHDFDPDTAMSRASLKAESPLFEQIPVAPTPPPGDSSTQLATTEFVYQTQAPFIDEAVIKSRIGSDGRFPAAPGDIGEYIWALIPPPGIELTTSQITMITTLELTPGDWDVQAQIGFNNTGLLPENQANVFYAGAINDTLGWPGFQDFGGAATQTCRPVNDVVMAGMYQRQLTGTNKTLFVLGYCQFPTPPRVYCYAYISARRRR